jgi:hypothetical protein
MVQRDFSTTMIGPRPRLTSAVPATSGPLATDRTDASVAQPTCAAIATISAAQVAAIAPL